MKSLLTSCLTLARRLVRRTRLQRWPITTWLYSRLVSWNLSKQEAVVELNGLRLRLFPRDVSMTPTMLMGLYEPQTLASFRKSLAAVAQQAKATGKPALVLDCGANVGLYTLLAAKELETCGRVIAFEPSPANRALLEENVVENQLENVEVMPIALAESSGEAWLQVESVYAGTHHLVSKEQSGQNGLRVPTVRLDQFCQERGLKPTLLKMDIEGAELLALPPALTFLQEAKTFVYLEMHTHQGQKVDDVRVLLDALFDQYGEVILLDDTANREIRLRSSQESAAVSLCHLGGNLLLKP